MNNILKSILLISLLICSSDASYAVDFVPMRVGSFSEYNKHDSATPQNNWTIRWEVLSEVTIGSYNYFTMSIRDYELGGSYYEIPVRSTETAVYFYNGTEDVLSWQKAAVGTTWNYIDDDGMVTAEIISIEKVTVPYGTFEAYVHKKHNAGSPDWYEYVVPGLGLVKDVDYWTNNAPTVAELSNTNFSPGPISYDANQNWIIGDFELLNAIDDWALESLDDFALLDLIDFWAAGCYHWDASEEKYKAECSNLIGAT